MNRSFSSITLLAFQGMLGFYMPLALLHNVRNAPGLLCQGCARSVPLLIPPPCGNTSPCGATSPPVRTGKEQTAVAEIEVRRMWEGGPLRQWTAKRPSSGKWVPYEHGGFAGRYVCADCQQTVAGLYRQNAGA